VRVRFRGINTVKKRLADGTVRIHRYHRATGHPLPGKPGSPEFIAAYVDAERSITGRLKGTFANMADDFINSLEFSKLAASTQEAYRGTIRRANIEFSDMPQAALEDPAVRGVFMDYRAKVAKQSGEREADTRLSVISAMLSWAVQNSELRSNNVAGFKRLYRADRSSMIWLPEQVSAFMAVAPIEMQRAMLLALHTGQRQGDLLRLTWNNYDGTAISLRQGKSRRLGVAGPLIVIPCTRALRRMLDGMPRVAATILTSRTGRPFQRRNFCKLWIDSARSAGVTDLHFHDLRGTAVTMLSEAGATHQ
jgi:integrase